MSVRTVQSFSSIQKKSSEIFHFLVILHHFDVTFLTSHFTSQFDVYGGLWLSEEKLPQIYRKTTEKDN